ncbi:MAG: tyrosine-type recombinase/integrase [Elusimicrobia bacterium]|nr:tyrosine-type recombinase/integrase [Elusimicrobiota bacterium]
MAKTKYSKEWLTKAEISQILNNPGISRRDELMISMLYWCALRVSEMAAIKIKDINIYYRNFLFFKSNHESAKIGRHEK